MERRLHLVAMKIRQKIRHLHGGVSYSQIASSGSNLIGLPGQSIQTYHNQPNCGWALAVSAGEWKGGSILWPWNSTKNWVWGGGVSHSQIATSGLDLIGLPSCNIQKYQNQPLDGWALAEFTGWWKGGSVLWPWNSTKIRHLRVG